MLAIKFTIGKSCMAERKLTSARRSFIPKLRDLDFSYQEIGEMFGVSDVTVYYCVYPERKSASMKKYYEHSATGTVAGGKRTITRGLRKRPRPDKCELCEIQPPRAYHHWDDNNPSVGLWLCYRCHMAAEAMEHSPHISLHFAYIKLKEKAAAEVAAERKKAADEIEVKRRRWQDARAEAQAI